MPDVVLCHPLRTPVGRFGGSLKSIPAPDPGARVVGETLRRAGLDGTRVDGAVMGQVVTAGAGMTPGRQAALNGGLRRGLVTLCIGRGQGIALLLEREG